MSIVFRRLALGGGGMKGILHIGALLELQKQQPLIFPNGVYGCSVGSLVATCVAFEVPIEKVIPLIPKYLTYEKVIPEWKFDHLVNSFSNKGLFEMDLFEKEVIEFFNEVGIDIRDKKISDAKMPLYIVSSNITKGVQTIFSGDVSLIKAIKASCCLPGVFKPQVIYDQVYIDGDIFTPCISKILPDKKETLVIILGKYPVSYITPKNVNVVSPVLYSQTIFSMIMNQFTIAQKTPDVVCLRYPNLRSTSDVKEFDMNDVNKVSGDQLRTFLAKSSNEKSTE